MKAFNLFKPKSDVDNAGMIPLRPPHFSLYSELKILASPNYLTRRKKQVTATAPSKQ